MHRIFYRAGALALLVFVSPAARAEFTVEGRAILRDGVPFQVRGVCYQPAPIGDDPAAAPPHGDYYTAEYDALIARDLPLIRGLGANVIRVYGWTPGADHTAFLDTCYNGGVDPIFVLVNRWVSPATPWNDAAAVDAFRQEVLRIDAGLGRHPAVLGILLGNEANAHEGNGAKVSFWQAMNSVAASLKQQNPERLVSMAITDAIPQIAARESIMTALDFWSVQTYRGTTLGTFFTEYAAASSRPLILTEWGVDAFDHRSAKPYPENGRFVAEAVAGLWSEIAGQAEVCSGGCVFEYADEWWKSGSPHTQDPGGFVQAGLPDSFANEEWWGLYAIRDAGADPDVLLPRAAVETLRTLWRPAVSVRVQPVSQTVAPGGAATFTVGAEAAGSVPLAYQWLKDGEPLPGATEASLALAGLSDAHSGWYSVRITAAATSVTSESVRLLVAVPQPGFMINMSVRSRAGQGADVLIAGFVVNGNVPRHVLIRGVGPGLVRHGVSDVLEDPILLLFDRDGREIARNDDWSVSPDAEDVAACSRRVGAFGLAVDSRDAAMQRTLLPGLFTAHVAGAGDTTGVALIEVYDVSAAP